MPRSTSGGRRWFSRPTPTTPIARSRSRTFERSICDNALRQLGAAVRAAAAVLHGRLERQLDVEQDNAAAAQSVLQLMFMDKLLADIDDAHALLEA
jgi:DnaJ-domain-containing protein 1